MADPDGREAMHHLGQHWDEVVAAELPSVAGLDPALPETIRRLHTLDARDAEPDPAAAFVRRAARDLLPGHRAGPVRPAALEARTLIAPNGRSPASGSRRAARAVRFPRGWPGAEVASLVVILVTLVTGFAAYRAAPPPASRNPSASVGLRGAAATADPVVSFDECSVAPRAGFLYMLGDSTPATDPIPLRPPAAGEPTEAPTRTPPEGSVDQPEIGSRGAGGEFVPLDWLPAGPAADSEVVTGIVTTRRDMTACRFYDRAQRGCDDARYVALLSDDYLRRALAYGGVPGVPTSFFYWNPLVSYPPIVD